MEKAKAKGCVDALRKIVGPDRAELRCQCHLQPAVVMLNCTAKRMISKKSKHGSEAKLFSLTRHVGLSSSKGAPTGIEDVKTCLTPLSHS